MTGKVSGAGDDFKMLVVNFLKIND